MRGEGVINHEQKMDQSKAIARNREYVSSISESSKETFPLVTLMGSMYIHGFCGFVI